MIKKAKLKYETRIPFFLIWKYLCRSNKWTLLLIIFLMSIAFINLVFVTSLFNGIIETANNQVIETFASNITMTPQDNQDFINNTKKILDKVKKIQGVKTVSSQTIVPGILKYKNIKGNWQILAVDPEKEKTVTNVSNHIIEGSYLEPNDNNKIIIGRQIAGGEGVEMQAFSFKGAKVGDKVNLTFGNQSRDFIIKGIFYTKFINTDEKAFITNKALENFNPFFKDKSTSILIKTEKKGNESEIINKLKNEGIKEKFYTWQEMAGLMNTITKSFLSINALLTFVGILIAAITIFIVIYVDILNKKKQIGILQAIGIRPYIIHTTYILQTVVYSCLGVLLGVGIFYTIIIPYFKAYPFQLPIGDVILIVNPVDFIARAEIIIWVAIFAGLIPAIIVTRIKILDTVLGK